MSEYKVGDVINNIFVFMEEFGGFHSKDNLFFKRVGDGQVQILSWSKTAPYILLASVILDAGSWASVVASVSRRGEDGNSHSEALEFHERQQP